MKGKNVIVVGGGLAAISTSLTIAAAVDGAKVTLIRPPREERLDTWQGLWTPALLCLSKSNIFGKDVLKRLKRDGGRYMTEAGYRNGENGKWIARPTEFMPSPVHFPSLDPRTPVLFFARESKLLNILEGQIEKSEHIHVVNDSFPVEFSFKEKNTQKSIETVRTQNEVSFSCDHLIVADGKFSQSRALLNTHIPLHYRGYRVTKGMTTRNITGNTSFQSWSKGQRFATVPVAGSDSNIWFFTNSEDECPESLDPDLDHTFGEDALSPVEETTRTWHEPIAEIVAETALETVHAQSALESFGNIYEKMKSNVYFVGDAARTLDPILAVGAGLAVEDGFDVAHTISCSRRGKASLNREARIRKLRFLSNLSQFSGQMNSSLLISIRDLFCTMNPTLTSRTFDSFMRSSVNLTDEEMLLFKTTNTSKINSA